MPTGINFLEHKKKKLMEVDTDVIKIGTKIRIKERRPITVGKGSQNGAKDENGKHYYKYLYYEIK